MGRPRSTSDAEILAAARALFRERGHAVTTREIADAAGVSQAVLYQRFPSKTELFFAAMAPSEPDVDAILGEAKPPVDAYLEGVAVRVLRYFAETHPTVAQLMAHPEFDAKVMGKLHERIFTQRLIGGVAGRLRALRAGGLVGDVDPERAAQTLIAALHSSVVFHVMSGASVARHAGGLASQIVEVLWRGLAPRR